MAAKNKGVMVTEGLEKDVLKGEEFPAVLAECFSRYAKMVLTDRAIPDARDGLKPVQRRIIFDMWKQGITYDKKTVKCAKTVGDVLGNYHPHGDSSVYDAMVRLSQDWKMEVPLLTFQGNNGSIDNDPPAAYRYTEAKLSQASYFMTKDLDEETVDMMLTFDDMNTEPVVLPAGFPNLLINGANGIAVGNATNIPTHNPVEIIDACVYRLQNPDCTLDELMGIVKGPDFPTGGVIDDQDAIRELYRTGKANFSIYAKAGIDYKKNQVVITQIPYGVVKSQFVADLDQRREKENLDNIEEVRDESASDIRIVLDVKKGASPQTVLDYLVSKGMLRTTFAANMLALDKGHPRTLGLLPLIDTYLDHRKDVVTRRSRFELKKCQDRLEIVEGLIKAESIIDEVIRIIRGSDSRADARGKLMQTFGFTQNQADAIGNMRLYSLNRIDLKALEDERSGLKGSIVELNKILGSSNYLAKVVTKELLEAEKAIARPRRTEIRDSKIAIKAVDPKSLIAAEQVMVVLTRDGYAKRTNLRSYQSAVQGRDLAQDLPTIKTGDRIVVDQQASTHDDILAFTSKGNYVDLPIWQLPEAKWHEEGKHLSNLITLDSSERIVNAFVVKKAKAGVMFGLLSRLGKIKRVQIKDLSLGKLTGRPLKAMSLIDDDQIVSVAMSSGNSDFLVVAQDGAANRFNENQVPLVGLKAAGVKAMNMPQKPIDLAFLLAIRPGGDGKLFVVCEKRKATVVASYQVPAGDRLGAKTQLVRIPHSSYTRLAGMHWVTKTDSRLDPVILALSTGSMAVDISAMGTSTIGVMLRTENITATPRNALVVGMHERGEAIDEDTPVDNAPVIPPKPVKAKSDDSLKQPTFFEVLDEDAGKKKN